MRVVVTGGAGFVGSHLVDALVDSQDDVVVVDALTEPVHLGRSGPDYLNRHARLVVADATDPAAMADALLGAEVVYHLAAYQDYRPDYARYFHVNSESPALLYELLRGSPSVRRVVLVSSQAAYGEGARICPTDGVVTAQPRPLEQLRRSDWNVYCERCGKPTARGVYREDDSVQPSSVYGVSKRCGELAALRLAQLTEIDTVVARLSIVVGARQSPRNLYSGACRVFASAMLADRPCPVFEDGEQTRDFVAVQDVVKALFLLGRVPETPQVINVGGGRAVSVNQMLSMVADALHLTPAVTSSGFRLGDTRDAISDCARLEALGWRASCSLEVAIAEYVEWLKTLD